MFERLDRDVSKIDVLIGQLLTLSRLEAGGSSTSNEVDLIELVEQVAADCDFEARASGRSVSFIGTGRVLLADADPHALRSAYENIIRNAVRFTRHGTTVEVVVKCDEAFQDLIGTVSIRDYGPGVPREALEAIFQPFYRIESDSPDVAGSGNGLGLAIAAEAIRLHRGTVSAINVLPSGLEMMVRLPAKTISKNVLSAADVLAASTI
jgi:signal transduction histidine kinase